MTVCKSNGHKADDHFNRAVKMVRWYVAFHDTLAGVRAFRPTLEVLPLDAMTINLTPASK